jgi:hypothetical protein
MFTHAVSNAEANAFSRFLGVPLVSTDVLTAQRDRRSYFAACGDSRSIFLDPDTGVRLRRKNGKRSPKFIFSDELVEITAARPQGLVLTFDQSLAYGSEAKQVREKLAHFGAQGLHGFAYVSHESFLILGKSRDVVADAKEHVVRASELPERRILDSYD